MINKTLAGIVLLAAGLSGCDRDLPPERAFNFSSGAEAYDVESHLNIEYDGKSMPVSVIYLHPILNSGRSIKTKIIVKFDDDLTLEILGQINGNVNRVDAKYNKAKAQQIYNKVLDELKNKSTGYKK